MVNAQPDNKDATPSEQERSGAEVNSSELDSLISDTVRPKLMSLWDGSELKSISAPAVPGLEQYTDKPVKIEPYGRIWKENPRFGIWKITVGSGEFQARVTSSPKSDGTFSEHAEVKREPMGEKPFYSSASSEETVVIRTIFDAVDIKTKPKEEQTGLLIFRWFKKRK